MQIGTSLSNWQISLASGRVGFQASGLNCHFWWQQCSKSRHQEEGEQLILNDTAGRRPQRAAGAGTASWNFESC